MILLKNGRVFDGSKKPSFIGSVLVKDGKVLKIFRENKNIPVLPDDVEVIDATGHWITPGFIDGHTHYDFELLVNPALTESVRHGVTTVVTGSCSISAIMSEPEDCSDIFTRVEGVSRDQVLPVLREKKTWNRPKEYVDFLQEQPLGPNVCAYIGHSDIRMAAMGIDKSVDGNAVPTEKEKTFMQEALKEALDVGFLGMSSMQSDADRLDGDRVRSKALPSVYASFKEYAYLNKVLRKYRRILQTAPDVREKYASMTHLLLEAMGLFRKPLKVASLVMIDAKSSRKAELRKLQLFFSKVTKLLFGDFRWQMLPCEFQAQVEGMNFVVFEEVPAGAAYLHLTENADREKLVEDPAFRAEFKKNMTEKFKPALWNRDIGDGHVYKCPDESLIGLSFAQIAKLKKRHVADVFIDLLVAYGNDLVWKVVIANERDEVLSELLEDRQSANIAAFSDAGAHIQNLAFYNFGLQMLARVKRMRASGIKTISDEHAIHRLTGELGDWHNIDAGYIREGSRADINVINPELVGNSLDSVERADFDGLVDYTRLVNRNDGIVKHVLINGKIAVSDDQYSEELGKTTEYGSFLRAS
jgi:N-acyl-D-aspartate/D-glutamate deacylase